MRDLIYFQDIVPVVLRSVIWKKFKQELGKKGSYFKLNNPAGKWIIVTFGNENKKEYWSANFNCSSHRTTLSKKYNIGE